MSIKASFLDSISIRGTSYKTPFIKQEGTSTDVRQLTTWPLYSNYQKFHYSAGYGEVLDFCCYFDFGIDGEITFSSGHDENLTLSLDLGESPYGENSPDPIIMKFNAEWTATPTGSGGQYTNYAFTIKNFYYQLPNGDWNERTTPPPLGVALPITYSYNTYTTSTNYPTRSNPQPIAINEPLSMYVTIRNGDVSSIKIRDNDVTRQIDTNENKITVKLRNDVNSMYFWV